jgi:hypothetical protein
MPAMACRSRTIIGLSATGSKPSILWDSESDLGQQTCAFILGQQVWHSIDPFISSPGLRLNESNRYYESAQVDCSKVQLVVRCAYHRSGTARHVNALPNVEVNLNPGELTYARFETPAQEVREFTRCLAQTGRRSLVERRGS